MITPAIGLTLLVIVTLVWGTTFVVIKDALEVIPPALLLAIRFTMALILMSFVKFDRKALKPALILGLVSFAGFAFQTVGIDLSSASNAAFITGLSVVLTPLVARIFWKHELAKIVWVAAFIALLGLIIMTLRDGFGAVSVGDLLVLITAASSAVYIVYLGEIANKYKVSSIAMMQYIPMALLSWLWAAPNVGLIPKMPFSAWLAIFYLAAVATVLATFLQILGQRVVSASAAAVVYTLEPVSAAAFAYLILGEQIGALGWLGGAIMVFAMLLTQIPEIRSRASRLKG